MNEDSKRFTNSFIKDIQDTDLFDQLPLNDLIKNREEKLNSEIFSFNSLKEYIKKENKRHYDSIKTLESIEKGADMFLSHDLVNAFSANVSNGRYDFIENDRFTFKYYPDWVDNEKEEWLKYYSYCLNTIYQENLIKILREKRVKAFIKKVKILYQRDFRKLTIHALYKFGLACRGRIKKTITRIKQRTHRYIFLAILCATIFNFFLHVPVHLITLPKDEMRTINVSLIGALASFLGFTVLFLGMAYENLKKNFGAYAGALFIKTPEIWELFILSIVTICLNLISSISVGNVAITYTNLLFNASTIFFTYIIILVYPYSRIILVQSSSILSIKAIVGKITLDTIYDFKKFQSEYEFTKFDIAAGNNNIEISLSIANHSATQNIFRIPNIILIEFGAKTRDLLLSDKETISSVVTDYSKQGRSESIEIDIISPLFELIKNTAKIAIREHNEKILSNIFIIIRTINETCALIKCDNKTIEFIGDQLEQIILLCSISGSNSIDDGVWAYYHCILSQLGNNCPVEEDTSYYLWSKKTKMVRSNYDKEFKWDRIRDMCTYDFPRIIEEIVISDNSKNSRYLLQRLHYLSDEILRMSLGESQKRALCRILYYKISSIIKAICLRGKLDRIHLPFSGFQAGESINKRSELGLDYLRSLIDSTLTIIKYAKCEPYELNELGTCGRVLSRNLSQHESQTAYLNVLNAFKEIWKMVEQKDIYIDKEFFVKEIQDQVDSLTKDIKIQDVSLLTSINDILFSFE